MKTPGSLSIRHQLPASSPMAGLRLLGEAVVGVDQGQVLKPAECDTKAMTCETKVKPKQCSANSLSELM